MALKKRHLVQRQQQQQGPGREILRKWEELWEMNPPPPLSTSSAHTYPSFFDLCSFLNLSVAASSCNFSSLDSLRQRWLLMRFKTKVPCPLSTLFWYSTTLLLSLCLSIWFAFTPQCFSSSSLDLLCHSITLANHRLSLPLCSASSLLFKLSLLSSPCPPLHLLLFSFVTARQV